MNRIKAFHSLGVDIHLHYFAFNKALNVKELNDYCKTVRVYKPRSFKECFTFKKPFIVSSRINEELITNLKNNNHPILLEGIQTTGILPWLNNGERKICVRIRDNEVIHYRELSRNTINPVKRINYRVESSLLKKYCKSLPTTISYACICENDCTDLRNTGNNNAFHIPAFSQWQRVSCPDGVGNLCLFHGNLSLEENEKTALWLLCNVFNKVRVPFVIAGRNPSRRLRKASELCQHTCLVSNPTDQELDDLIEKAHINILPSLNKSITGMRLKLLHALYKGRHCVVTPAMVDGTGLAEACHIGRNSKALASIISQLYYQPFNEEEIVLRKHILHRQYNNDKNILLFKDLLW